MPRENSFTDEDGRSLTPELDEDWQPGPQPEAPDHPRTRQSPRSSVSSHRPVVSKHPLQAATMSPDLRVPLTPRERFRSSVRKVIHMSRTSKMMSGKGVGAEPGIDARRDSAFLPYGHLSQECLIDIIDYSSVRSSFGRMTNREFIDFLDSPKASEREPWVKVRWINVGGLSWDVVRALAIKYNLHPLAIEDVLSRQSHPRSKADYHQNHLFLLILSHTLTKLADRHDHVLDHFPRSDSSELMDEKVDSDEGYNFPSELRSRPAGSGKLRRRKSVSPPSVVDLESSLEFARFGSFAPSVGAKHDATTMRLVKELNSGDRVNVTLSPVCIFLLRDGTVISIHPKNDLEFTAPIRDRLRQRHTGLRNTADPSLLVHSLLDLVVDATLEVVDEYQKKIVKLEHDILLRPRMTTIRLLHVLSGDLILHKRTLAPIKTVIYGLRRYDSDRVAAMYDASNLPTGWKPQGYMSHKANIYLADVFDHIEYALTSMEMFANICENLINYTFNVVSNEMNQVMRKLTLVTIICLPLTLLTGYFGMNFVDMWSIHAHSDIFFWEIAIPLIIVVVPLLTWRDLAKLFHYVRKTVRANKLRKR